MMIGYKAFDKYLINRYGFHFEVGKEYKVTGDLKFGNNGNGFHFCTNLEDTLRYVDGNNAIITQVESNGNLKKYDDDYYGYYDMYVTDNIKIIRIISKEEILKYTLSLNNYRLIKMLRDYKKFTKEEIALLENRFKNNIEALKVISYYQKGDKDTYKKYTKH